MLHFPKMQHFGKIPKRFGQNVANINYKSDKFCKICFKKSATISGIFNEQIEIRERCEGVHCVDLGESFLSMSLFLNLLFETDSYSNEYLLAKIGVDTTENELLVHLIFQPWDLIFTEPPRPLRSRSPSRSTPDGTCRS